MSDMCSKDLIFNLIKLKCLETGTNIQAEYWTEWYGNLITYLAGYLKYGIVKTHTSDDSGLNEKTLKPIHVE